MMTNKRKKSRQLRRSINALLYEENAEALALLSQQQEDYGIEYFDGVQHRYNNIHEEFGLPEGSENGSMECDDSLQCTSNDSQNPPGRDVSFEPKQAMPSLRPHRGSDVTMNNDEVGSNHTEHETFNDFEDGSESNSSTGDGESETIQDRTSEQPGNNILTLNQNDFSAEVWRIIKGEAEENTQEENMKITLAKWSLKNRIKRNSLSELLHILRDHGHSHLPACAKTLLKTPRSTRGLIRALGGGHYWYRGIENALLSCISKGCVLENDTAIIDIFVDGLSPHKKVKRSIWPIAGCLKGEKTPFVIALWCGSFKEPTSVQDFFEDFTNESADLIADGFLYNGREIKFSIRRYLADAPARAWIKQVKQHGSYNSCERCTIRGEWKFRRITYNPAQVCTLRTDESLNNQCDEDHHIGVSPLLRLGTNLISQIPLDIMHMVYLGVSKRIHSMLVRQKAGRFKLCVEDVGKIDKLCLFLYKFCPSEFASKPRPLSQHKLYKATEWRRLLLYDGFLLNKSHKHKELNECYLLVACAMRILLDPQLRTEFIDDAHKLLETFVKRSYRDLGPSFVVYNVHHMLHLVSDCILHGDPEGFSCFKYESHLGHLKHDLVAPGRTLQQLICRLIERSLAPVATPPVAAPPLQLCKPHTCGPTLDCTGKQYTAARFEGFVIRIAKESISDSFVLMSSKKVVVVENIVNSKSTTYIIGRQFMHMSDYFGFPLQSSLLNIYKVSNLGPLKKWSIDKIMKKVFYFPIVIDGDYNSFNWREDSGLCVPILHSEVEDKVI